MASSCQPTRSFPLQRRPGWGWRPSWSMCETTSTRWGARSVYTYISSNVCAHAEAILKGDYSFACVRALWLWRGLRPAPLQCPSLKFLRCGGTPERRASVTCHSSVLLFLWTLCIPFLGPLLGSPLTGGMSLPPFQNKRVSEMVL